MIVAGDVVEVEPSLAPLDGDRKVETARELSTALRHNSALLIVVLLVSQP